jgi:hypothetical protein
MRLSTITNENDRNHHRYFQQNKNKQITTEQYVLYIYLYISIKNLSTKPIQGCVELLAR